MVDPIRPVTLEPQGDDQAWKRQIAAVVLELVNRQAADRSDIDILKSKI